MLESEREFDRVPAERKPQRSHLNIITSANVRDLVGNKVGKCDGKCATVTMLRHSVVWCHF